MFFKFGDFIGLNQTYFNIKIMRFQQTVRNPSPITTSTMYDVFLGLVKFLNLL